MNHPMPEPTFVTYKTARGRSLALLLHDYRTGKAWVLKWQPTARKFVQHAMIVNNADIKPALPHDSRLLAARAAFQRGAANESIRMLRELMTMGVVAFYKFEGPEPR